MSDKNALRTRVMAARKREPDKGDKSAIICGRVEELAEFQSARRVQFYIDVRSEVRTRPFLARALEAGMKVIVPYCVDDHLELFHLRKMEELEPGCFGILEPRNDLRGRPARRFDIENVDLILVPGVAFDRRGGRMGHGRGFYDRLLRRARPQTPLIALAFECQLVEAVPMEEHDLHVDKVVTENTIYEGRHRRSQFTAD